MWIADHTDADRPGVVTCSALKRAYRDKLAGLDVVFVHLAGTKDIVEQHLAARLNHFMPGSLLESQIATLETPEADENAVTILAGRKPADTAAEIIRLLVSEADFVAAQQLRAERATGDGRRRRYLLRGLLRCGYCGRRMDAHWVHKRAGYRCRHGHRSTMSRPADSPDSLYVREDAMLSGLAARITIDDGDAAGTTALQDVLDLLRSNAMVIEVFSSIRWAVTTRS